MPNKAIATLRRTQLDRQLRPFARRASSPPKRGWIREIREALGMTGRQLAARLGVRGPTVTELQRSEVHGSISLKSLARVADAMNCRLVYAIVPLEGTLARGLQLQARRIAKDRVAQVARTMDLEAQRVSASFRDREIAQLAEELIRTLPRDLWEPGM